MNKPARYNHFWAQRRSKCSLCMIFNGLSRNTFNADAIFFPGDPYISRTTVLDNNKLTALICYFSSIEEKFWFTRTTVINHTLSLRELKAVLMFTNINQTRNWRSVCRTCCYTYKILTVVYII